MFDAAGNRPRLIVIGAEADQGFEPLVSKLSRCFEVTLVGGKYSTWSAEYADVHRVCAYLTYDSLFNAVVDLMGEVPFCGAVALDHEVDGNLSRICRKLGLPDTAGEHDVPTHLGSGRYVLLERGAVAANIAYRVTPGNDTLEQVCVPDVSEDERRSLSVSLIREGAGKATISGLSPVLRSGLVDGLPAQEVGKIAVAAFDESTRRLMRWTELVA